MGGLPMILAQTSRRLLLGGGAALAAGALFARGSAARGAVSRAAELKPIPLPPPIGPAERLVRLAKARELMQRHGIGAVLVESGPSLDYFTGIQWWRSERLTGAVIPASGDPIIVTPFFEQPSIKEMLGIPAEIRTWQEDEQPLKLVADFLKERGLAAEPIGFEETNRFFLMDRLKQQLPSIQIVSANPVVRALRMIKSPAELALMQAANDIMLVSLRYAGERTREGMTPAEIDAMIAAVHKNMGSAYDGGLILIGEASAYPHGSKQPHVVQQGDIVLLDCTSSVHG
jgi:Xaa-Pro dipeptidase